MKPTIGRIVHFHAWRGGPPDGDPALDTYAGIIVAIRSYLNAATGEMMPSTDVDLCTLGPNSVYHNHAVPFSETPKAGHWSWPPRTP